MAQDNWQKLKILKLAELLQQETDEEHPLKTAQICARLEEMGIPCDRRTLAADIDLLNEQGMEIQWLWLEKSKAFYVEDRSFSIPELKILIDAVQAASFITDKKTEELIDKIAELGGTHRASILKSNLVQFNTRKHSNERIYYNVDALEGALQKRQKVIFRYFDLGINAEKVYRREGHHYVVEPVGLVFNEDNYYLIAYSEKHDDTANYRVDRMDSVEMIDEKISEKAMRLRRSVGRYTEQAIKMYGGQRQSVTLAFDKSLVDSVYDRFGEGTKMKALDENQVKATVRVQLSPTFWGWLFQFGELMNVLGPESVIEEYKRRAAALL